MKEEKEKGDRQNRRKRYERRLKEETGESRE